jgi:hypothetical protein
VQSREYYGEGYQDILTRVPSIKNAEKYLGWKPTTDLKTGLRKTLDYHLGSRRLSWICSGRRLFNDPGLHPQQAFLLAEIVTLNFVFVASPASSIPA